ncbi:MAG: hypothetical protein M4579_005379 [Chaenotheca gracillima]|nr:MAG: hypothetical protein M4579_005379 [Chaenotheca gracillima]
MFWRFGGYNNASSIDNLLDKPDTTLEELLDESDLIQELKQHNSKLIEYMRNENTLHRLLQYVVAPKPDDLEEEEQEDGSHVSPETSSTRHSQDLDRNHRKRAKSQRRDFSEEDRERDEKARLKYAYVACEVLSVEIFSILESILAASESFHEFWQFLKRDPPLDPLQAGYFTKVNESLLDKKTEETLEILRAQDNVVHDMLKNVDCPMIMDLLLKIISLGKADEGQSVVDWLHSQDLIPALLSYLSMDHSSSTQTSAGDFLKAVITISANASQNEQSCIGPNDLTRQLVSDECIRQLIADMLRGGNPLTVGVGIIIEVIRKNNSDYDPEVGAGADAIPTSRDPIYLGTLLRLFAQNVPEFMTLILSSTYSVQNEDGSFSTKVRELKSASGETIEPLGFDRFKTCELMAELLHCSNMGLLNERGGEKFVKDRDRERDRLKSEGHLMTSRDGQSEEFAHDGSGFYPGHSPSAMGSGSPEEIRKLEIANRGEEDGFEDVAVSDALNDEVKDDFDEKAAMEHDLPESSSHEDPTDQFDEKTIEDEFVDEPLSSPRLELSRGSRIESEDVPPLSPSSSEKPPLSPTSAGLTEKVVGLDLSQMNNDSDYPTAESKEGKSIVDKAPADPARPSNDERAKTSDDTQGSESKSTLSPLNTEPQSGGLSPHPDDEPAPLFASRTEQKTGGENELAPNRPGIEEAQSGDSQETVDTTLGEEGDSVRSVLMAGNEVTFEPHIELDIDGTPVVGDYLKMMFVEHRVVPTILDFFFRFPWNNFLHNVVYDVVQQVFNGPMDRGYNRSLAIDLFETGRITERIVEGQRKSDKSQAETNMRLGYMGHLTLIAEEVVKFTERNPPELLSQSVMDKVMHNDWVHYVEKTLAETRERDNAILGGVRPDMSVGPRQAVINSLNAAQGYSSGPSTALANAGLGGGGGLDSLDLANGANAAGGGFSLSSGSLLGGFGNNSDEEDDEMEEENEDDSIRNHEFNDNNPDQYSQFTATAGSGPEDLESSKTNNNNGGSSNGQIPVIPPPPPPLNVGPSRARRQLQSRLVAKAKREEENRARLEAQARGEVVPDDEDDREALRAAASAEYGLGDDDVWADHEIGGEDIQQQMLSGRDTSTPSQSSSEGDDASDDEDDGDLMIPPFNRPSSSGPRRPSTTEATTRSALETESDDEEEAEDDEDDDDNSFGDFESEVVDLGGTPGDDDGADLVKVSRSTIEKETHDNEKMTGSKSTDNTAS